MGREEIWVFTEGSIEAAVEPITVDLFARDADAALSRESLRTVSGRERERDI